MADAFEILQVRRNTNELEGSSYTDEQVGDLIDSYGVDGASALIWREKAAGYADLVNTSEGGTRHDFSDLHKNALKMADHFEGLIVIDAAPAEKGPIIKTIVRE
jgi:hypothetical protein